MRQNIWLWLCILWMLLIWIVSSIPSRHLPDYSILGLDKIAHFGVYFIWGILSNIWLHKRKLPAKRIWLTGFIMLALALADESHQYYIPGRDLSIYDFLANALGLIAAFSVFRLWGHRWLK